MKYSIKLNSVSQNLSEHADTTKSQQGLSAHR